MKIEVNEVYELAKHLHDASLLMKKLDDAHAHILINMASDVMDMINSNRFSPEESVEIDDIVKELVDG
jgi:hypothetical protein